MRIGIDIGGSKIEGVLLADDGRIARSLRVPTPKGDYPGILRAVAGVVEALDAPSASLGIGAPGSAADASDGRRLWKNSNATVLNGKSLEADLAAVIARPIRLANDANCFAISEAIDGAAAGADVVFGVILGTGCGGGVVVRGRAVAGPNGLAGEWGHFTLPFLSGTEYPGHPCYCGRMGCIETFLSGPALERQYHAVTGAASNATGIADAAATGDHQAAAVFDMWLDRLARALTAVLLVLDPDVVVFGGGLSRMAGFVPRLPEAVARHVGVAHLATRFVLNRHGDASGVRGAANLWPLHVSG